MRRGTARGRYGSLVEHITLGTLLAEARAALGVSLQDVAERAGCSPGYVHKLEADRVRTPSPRVLAGLAEALGVPYDDLMHAAGYEAHEAAPAPPVPGVVKRYSNAHIVELLEALQRDVAEVKARLGATR